MVEAYDHAMREPRTAIPSHDQIARHLLVALHPEAGARLLDPLGGVDTGADRGALGCVRWPGHTRPLSGARTDALAGPARRGQP